MKTLLIMRHAKSSWDDESLPDYDRPLNKRGQKDAPRMGQLLLEEQLGPDLILSSTALRARTTAEIVAREIKFGGEIELQPDLYHAEPEDYIRALKALKDPADQVLIVGHNPGLEDLLALLTGGNEHLPTAAIAVVEFSIAHWRELTAKTKGRRIRLWRPKEL